MTLRKSLFSNSFASAGSIFWSALIQVATVPVLLKYWGSEQYGIWLMLSTIPTYLALSDLGLASAATSDMTMAFARGNIDQVNKTFQSILKITSAISSFILFVVFLSVWLCKVFNVGSIIHSYHYVICVLAIYACFSIFSRIILAGYRSAKQYAFGTIIYDFMQFIEGCSVLVIAMLGFSFFEAALGLLIGRLLLIFVLIVLIKKRLPEIRVGFSLSSVSEMRRLLKPAIGALAIPSALAINMQGMVLVTGLAISPMAAAILSPTRTISRIAIQLVGIVNRATMPEFSAAFAKKNRGTIKKLITMNLFVMGLILAPGAVLFGMWGDFFVELWSHHKVFPPKDFVILIAVAMFIHGCWYFSSNLLLAMNRHTQIAATLLLSSIMAVLLAFYLAPSYGLLGVGGAIVLAEMIALVRVAGAALSVRAAL